MASFYCSTCSCLWYPISINGHQTQLCTVKPFQVWQKRFSEHDIDIHQTENHCLQRQVPERNVLRIRKQKQILSK